MLQGVADAYAYRDRLTMPKLIVNSTGDQLFLPDSSRFYFDELKAERYLRYVPNIDRSLSGSDADESVSPFYASIISGTLPPKFVWRFEGDGSIRVTTETKPLEVRRRTRRRGIFGSRRSGPRTRARCWRTRVRAFTSARWRGEQRVRIGRAPPPGRRPRVMPSKSVASRDHRAGRKACR